MIRTISIVNLDKHQHYKDRNPPWIKLYNSLLDNYEYACLHDDSKLLQILFLLLASKKDNKIPYDLDWIQNKLMLKEPVKDSSIKELQDAGFIEVHSSDSNVLSICKQGAIPEREGERETEGENSLREKKRKTRIPKDFALTEKMQEYANGLRYCGDLQSFTDNFTDACEAHGYKYVSFERAWQTWLRKDIKDHPENQEKKVELV